MTEKKKYEKPSQRVIELQHRTMLLTGSKVDPLDPFNPGGDPLNP